MLTSTIYIVRIITHEVDERTMMMSAKALKMNKSLVCFIDILGFKNKLLTVSSNEDLNAVYSELITVHKYFDKDLDDMGDFEKSITEQSHKTIAKRIIALSDALVISIDFESEYSKMDGVFDTIAGELNLIGICQGLCVLKGIFLRGGVSTGYYYHNRKKDIIISDGIAKSYDVENKAMYPIIALSKSFYEFVCKHPDNRYYADAPVIKNELLRECAVRHKGKIDTLYFIDYLSISIDASDEWNSNKDLERYKAEKDKDKKNNIMRESCHKSVQRFIAAHQQAIKIELAKKHVYSVRKKYLWLKKYHNETIDLYKARYSWIHKYKIR